MKHKHIGLQQLARARKLEEEKEGNYECDASFLTVYVVSLKGFTFIVSSYCQFILPMCVWYVADTK